MEQLAHNRQVAGSIPAWSIEIKHHHTTILGAILYFKVGGDSLMPKRLAINTKGQLTYCSAPEHRIGVGRCNHVDHQKAEETSQEFIIRTNGIVAENAEHLAGFEGISHGLDEFRDAGYAGVRDTNVVIEELNNAESNKVVFISSQTYRLEYNRETKELEMNDHSGQRIDNEYIKQNELSSRFEAIFQYVNLRVPVIEQAVRLLNKND